MDARDTETPAAHRGGETATTKLSRIAERARREPKAEFTSLYHLMNEELLRDCFQRLSASSAAGIDKVTKAEYAEELEKNLTQLVSKLQTMAYRPRPVRRVYIPKPGTDKSTKYKGTDVVEEATCVAAVEVSKVRTYQLEAVFASTTIAD